MSQFGKFVPPAVEKVAEDGCPVSRIYKSLTNIPFLNALTESTLMSLLSLTLVKVGGEEILTKGPMFLQHHFCQGLKSPVFGLVQMGLPHFPMVNSHLKKTKKHQMDIKFKELQ